MSKFKRGDKVKCVKSTEAEGVYIGEVYTICNPHSHKSHMGIHVSLDEVISTPPEDCLKLVECAGVLTPEEVLKHLLAGTKMEYQLDNRWYSHSGDLNLLSVQLLVVTKWRVKPTPKTIDYYGIELPKPITKAEAIKLGLEVVYQSDKYGCTYSVRTICMVDTGIYFESKDDAELVLNTILKPFK